jgi:4-aminobutyrate aminotransferase
MLFAEYMTHAELWERHRAVMPAWLALYYQEPIEIVSGSGRRVTDGEGKEYSTSSPGSSPTRSGTTSPRSRTRSATSSPPGIAHTSTVYLIRRQIELAEKIAQLSGIPDAKVFFTNSGTEANEAVLMLATQHRRSTRCWRCATPTTAGPSAPWPSPATAAGPPAACHR